MPSSAPGAADWMSLRSFSSAARCSLLKGARYSSMVWGLAGIARAPGIAALGTRGGKNVLRAPDRRELTMKTRQRDAMHEIRAVVSSIGAAALEGRGRILDLGDGEAQVPRHPRRRRHAVVGCDPDDDERLDSIGAQVRLEVGSDERAVDMLA